MIDPDLKGKVALVTGANNVYGIGAAVAKAFAEQGAKIFLHYFRQDAPTQDESIPSGPSEQFYRLQQTRNADEVLRAVRTFGVEAGALEGDLSDPSTIRLMFDKAEGALGPVEVLVNNAAYWEADTFLPATTELANTLVELWSNRPSVIGVEGFGKIFAVNTRAVALATAEFARRHIERKARWGRIINISTAGAECFPSEATYGVSKLAVEGYTRTAAVELGQFGITVNVLSLGPVQTGWITPELEDKLLPTIPLRRIGKPEDVAAAVVFLASNQASWITGQRISVGGGHERR